MKAIKNGKIFIDDNFITNKVLIFKEKIVEIIDEKDFDEKGFEVYDANYNYVLPGFIDQHIHGFSGVDSMTEYKEDLIKMSKSLIGNGVTSFLPTTSTTKKESLHCALKNIKSLMNQNNNGAKIVGAHFEGPYINPKNKGALNEKYIVEPDFEFFENFKNVIKVATVAVEMPKVLELVNQYKDIVNFQIGHTKATFDETMASFTKGIKGATHTFNAMTPIHHRDMGAVGAILTSECYAEFIFDNIHITPHMYDFILKNKSNDKILLVTDSISAGGLNDGEYSLGGLKVNVKNGACTLDNGVIAGSTLRLNIALKNLVENSSYDLKDCVKMVSTNQAKYLGLKNVGELKKDYFSDIVIMDKNFKIQKTFINGICEYKCN